MRVILDIPIDVYSEALWLHEYVISEEQEYVNDKPIDWTDVCDKCGERVTNVLKHFYSRVKKGKLKTTGDLKSIGRLEFLKNPGVGFKSWKIFAEYQETL